SFRIVDRSTVVAVDTEPVHLAAAQHLILSDDRDVVFSLTTDNAGVAADAGVDVDRHPPFVAFVRAIRIQRDGPRRRLLALVHRLRIPSELVVRYGANDRAPLHQVVVLRTRE